jgi:hypothetical protein
MKKVFSISLIILMLAAILHLSVANHYCMGRIAASKISLEGKLGTCGMEDAQNNQPVEGTTYSSHCCENVIHYYGITSSFFPTFSFVPETYQQQFHNYDIAYNEAIRYSSSVIKYSDESPPGELVYNSVDLSDICILRI